jgi:hypothetical protein
MNAENGTPMESAHTPHKESKRWTWLLVGLMVAYILGKGFYSFFVVGDMGQPTWDYPIVKDVPAESPFATYKLLPDPQHVRGARGE